VDVLPRQADLLAADGQREPVEGRVAIEDADGGGDGEGAGLHGQRVTRGHADALAFERDGLDQLSHAGPRRSPGSPPAGPGGGPPGPASQRVSGIDSASILAEEAKPAVRKLRPRPRPPGRPRNTAGITRTPGRPARSGGAAGSGDRASPRAGRAP